jgi:hypothetical protein
LENSGLKIASAQLETWKIPAINPGLHENYTKSKQKDRNRQRTVLQVRSSARVQLSTSAALHVHCSSHVM